VTFFVLTFLVLCSASLIFNAIRGDLKNTPASEEEAEGAAAASAAATWH
jgi:hypothetical protein